MTIWILVILLLASEAGLGLQQGAIRVAFSLLGILLGAVFATPLGHLLKPLLTAIGIKHPIVLWLLPAVVAFFVVLVLFKIAGYAVHRKVEVYYKYKTGDLLLALWKRLNARLGLCLGLVNGAAYVVLISFALYAVGYWTVQMSTPSNPWTLKLVNRLSEDLHRTGMERVACSIDDMPPVYYETANVAGLLYHNPSLKYRLYQYPLFITLAERTDFQSLVNDSSLAGEWKSQAPFTKMLHNPGVDNLFKNRELLNTFWEMVRPNLADLDTYLKTGKSPKYAPEKILGRWDFDVNGTIGLIRMSRPNIPSKEMAQIKNWFAASFAKTTFVATTDRKAILKSFPYVKIKRGEPPTTEIIKVEGQWRDSNGAYTMSYTLGGHKLNAKVEIKGDRLTISGKAMELAFYRQS